MDNEGGEKERTNMKLRNLGLAAGCALAIAAFVPATDASQGGGIIDIGGSRWGERWGGEGRLGGEYIFDEIHYGIGGHLGLGVYAGDDKEPEAGLGMPISFELYVPVQITDAWMAYGGGGLTVHIYNYYMNKDRSQDYHGRGETSEQAFVGLRYVFGTAGDSRPFLFCEYRQDFGEITVEHERTEYNRKTRKNETIKDKLDVDMSGGRILVGFGMRY